MARDEDRTLLNTQRIADMSQGGNGAEQGKGRSQASFDRTLGSPLDPTTIVKDSGSPSSTPSSSSLTEEPTLNHIALPVGHQLFEYTIEALLGSGGFGQTYLARDNHLQCQVAIKEYLPHDVAIRVEGQTVCPRAKQWSEEYQIGLKRFLNEARTLASFRHPNIVRITRFFEANGTAYMVMDYERGQSLREWKRNHAALTEEEVLRMFLPLLEGLAVVHQGNITHRDIKPANIYVRETDGSLVLLDFGSARLTQNLGSQGLTTVITPGYAPFEQYHSHGVQGPWSDIYSMGGVLYWMITGEKPVEAPARLKDDTLVPARQIARGRFSQAFLAAVDWALETDEDRRPRKVSDFRAALTGQMAVPTFMPAAAPASPTPATAALPAHERSKSLKPLWLGVAVAGIAAASLAGYYFAGSRQPPASAPVVLPAPAPLEPPTAVASLPATSAPAPQIDSKSGGDGKALPEAAVPPVQTSAPPSPSDGKLASANKVATPKAVASPPEKTAAKTTKPPRQDTVSTAQAESIPTVSMARVALKVTPRGEVFLDGKRLGNSPPLTEIPLTAGQHKLEIRGDALPFVSYHLLDLKAGETRHVSQKFGDN